MKTLTITLLSLFFTTAMGAIPCPPESRKNIVSNECYHCKGKPETDVSITMEMLKDFPREEIKSGDFRYEDRNSNSRPITSVSYRLYEVSTHKEMYHCLQIQTESKPSMCLRYKQNKKPEFFIDGLNAWVGDRKSFSCDTQETLTPALENVFVLDTERSDQHEKIYFRLNGRNNSHIYKDKETKKYVTENRNCFVMEPSVKVGEINQFKKLGVMPKNTAVCIVVSKKFHGQTTGSLK
jgi:hypothetical protein